MEILCQVCVCFHFCSVGELTGVSDALQWPCVVVPCRTFSLLDGVVFLLDLSQVGPHADERLMDRVLCFVPALLSSCSPAFFPFFSFLYFSLLDPRFFILVFGTFWRCFLGVSIAHLRIVVGSWVSGREYGPVITLLRPLLIQLRLLSPRCA